MAEIQQTVQSGAAVELRAGVLRVAGSRSLQMLAALVLIGAVMMRIEFAGPAILDNDGYDLKRRPLRRPSLPLPRSVDSIYIWRSAPWSQAGRGCVFDAGYCDVLLGV